MYKMIIPILFGSTLLAQAYDPSFDCVKASTSSEKLICSDEVLSKLDNTLAKTYNKTFNAYPKEEREDLSSEQKMWVKKREKCMASSLATGCVKRAYETRISQLQISGGQVVVPEAVYYKCDGKTDNSLTVVFYNNVQLPTVVLTLPSEQYIAYAAMSGSGAKYISKEIEFWEHHGDATLNYHGKSIRCKKFTNK